MNAQGGVVRSKLHGLEKKWTHDRHFPSGTVWTYRLSVWHLNLGTISWQKLVTLCLLVLDKVKKYIFAAFTIEQEQEFTGARQLCRGYLNNLKKNCQIDLRAPCITIVFEMYSRICTLVSALNYVYKVGITLSPIQMQRKPQRSVDLSMF